MSTSNAERAPRRAVDLLGVRIDALHLHDLLELVTRSVRLGERLTVLYVNVHCMNVAWRDSEYRRLLDAADVVYCDGTGVRLATRIAGEPVPQRMTGADWIFDLARLAVREDLRLYLLGGQPGVADRAASVLRVRHPGLHIVGAAPGFGAGTATVAAINASGADILLVGMGTPTQETWIAAHAEDLDVPVVWAVGALFDFVSGKLWRGPRLLTEHGFEWLCRLVVEPRKLWRRYLIGNPLFFGRVFGRYVVHPWLRRVAGRERP